MNQLILVSIGACESSDCFLFLCFFHLVNLHNRDVAAR